MTESSMAATKLIHRLLFRAPAGAGVEFRRDYNRENGAVENTRVLTQVLFEEANVYVVLKICTPTLLKCK